LIVLCILQRQLRAARRGRFDGSLDLEALLKAVDASYGEYERERRLNDRAARLMEEEIMAANARIEREATDAIAAVFRSVGEGILVLTPEGVVDAANPVAEQIFGRPERDLIGRSLEALIRLPQGGADAPGAIAVAVGATVEGEAIRSAVDAVPIEVSFAALRLDGKPKQLAIVRNITDRKSRERELIAAREAAEAANAAKSNFLASMSHELRTPLNAILGFAEVIRDRIFGAAGEAKYAEYAASIHVSGRHLLSLIDDILDLAKIEAGREPLARTEVDLAELTRDAIEMVRVMASQKRLDLRVVAPKEPVTVAVDPRAVRQIALNLLSNAVKFTPTSGHIEAIVESGEGCALTVRDSGIGIAREDLPHVFEPFHRANSQLAREHPGTGLGLAITRRLVELHGGEIELASDLGKGTSVTVRLPKVAA
jgi:PAS domain S-box-containing protein